MGKGSWAVLRQDKELMLLPVIGLAVMIVVALVLLIPLITVFTALETTNEFTGASELSGGGSALAFVLILAGYYLLTLINQVFAGGVVHGAYTRMTGGDPTVMSSIKAAGSKTKQLIPWAIATGTVGLLLDALRDKGFIGKIIAGFISFAWKTATFLVLPILVIEGLGPRDAYNRSRQLMSGRWGESASATFGFILIGFVASLPALFLIFIGGQLGGSGFILIGLAFVWLAVTSVVINTLTGVMRAALYLYTVSGEVPADFQGVGLESAFG